MLLNSTQGISRLQHKEESSSLQRKIEEESSWLRHKIEELNKNTVLLIAEAGKLIQASEHCRFGSSLSNIPRRRRRGHLTVEKSP